MTTLVVVEVQRGETVYWRGRPYAAGEVLSVPGDWRTR